MIEELLGNLMIFRGKYFFLSNFYPCRIEYDGLVYQNAEAAYQAQKELDFEKRKSYQSLNPYDAKRHGRSANLRSDWDDIKDSIMHEIVLAKFQQNPDLKWLLMDVVDPIVEENTWNDTYWGVCRGKGLNKLGEILTMVRQKFLENDNG